MATTATSTLTFRVTNLTESGFGRVSVGMVQVTEGADETAPLGTSTFNSNLTLNLPSEEGKAYYPGQTYTVSLSPTTT